MAYRRMYRKTFRASSYKNNDQIHSELLELHRMAVGDIAFFKKQQWQVTNYGLLLYGVIVAAPRLVETLLSSTEYFTLWIISLVILFVGIFLLLDFERSLDKGRNRLPAVRKHFNREITLHAYAGDRGQEHALITSKDRSSLLWFFISTMILGFVFTTWILARFWCKN